jgi:hypothetical protein
MGRGLSRSPRPGRNSVASVGCSVSDHQPIDDQQDDCANDATNEARALAWSIPTEPLAKERRHERSYDANDARNNDPTWVTAGHDELGYGTNDQTHDYCDDE